MKKIREGMESMLYILATATILFTYYVAKLMKEQREEILIPIKVDDRPMSHRQ